MKFVYILSGLGADHRIFQKMDFGHHEVIYIPWHRPKKREAIEEYAKKLAEQIKHEKPVLLGLSFGGMMAMELAKHKDFEKIILISSSKTRAEIPALYKFLGALRLNKLAPAALIKNSKAIINRAFATRSTTEKALVGQMLQETDPDVLEWSLEKILRWKNTIVPSNVYHIHGTKDHVLPLRNITCDKLVQNGGHLMILNRAEELSMYIKSLI